MRDSHTIINYTFIWRKLSAEDLPIRMNTNLHHTVAKHFPSKMIELDSFYQPVIPPLKEAMNVRTLHLDYHT
jgi:hypothetical protein